MPNKITEPAQPALEETPEAQVSPTPTNLKFKLKLPSIPANLFPKNLTSIKPLHIASAIVVLTIVVSGFFYWRSQQELQALKSNPQAALKKENQDLVSRVGQLVTLPKNENPTVATVTNPEKLKSQPFFAASQKDDKVLIYTNAKKAILYRPSINKVVDIAPISGSTTPQGQVAGSQANQKLRLVIFNGTNTTGLARKYQKEVETKVQNSQVTTVGDAKSKDTAKTFVVSLSGADAIQIASTLGIEKGNLPDGEQKPDADFLIILGQDKSGI